MDGTKVSVTSTGMGCPSTAICVEELIKIGADTFIRVGTSGTVKDPEDEKTYDGVIVTAAVRDEGTTRQYIPIEYPAIANRHVVAALADAAQARGKHYLEGISQTKDSFYGEVDPDCAPLGERLKERWRAWQMGNVACSEMECAALFVISSIRNCRASAIMNWADMDIRQLMNADGGGSAMLGLTADGSFLELSCPSTSDNSTVGMVRLVNTVFYIPAGDREDAK